MKSTVGKTDLDDPGREGSAPAVNAGGHGTRAKHQHFIRLGAAPGFKDQAGGSREFRHGEARLGEQEPPVSSDLIITGPACTLDRGEKGAVGAWRLQRLGDGFSRSSRTR